MGSSALLLILLMSFIHSGLNQGAGVKPVVKVTPDQPVFRGERVTLTCDLQGGGNIQWFKYGNPFYPYTTTAEFSFTAEVSHSGEYSCRGERSHSQTDISAAVTLTVSDLPTSTLTVTPDNPVFTGETVNLKCVIETYSKWRQRNYLTYEWRYWTNEWRYEWYKDSSKLQTSERYTVNEDTLSIVGAVTSDQGWYMCRGLRDGRPNSSHSSSAVYLSVSVTDSPTSTLTVTPDSPVFTGETVNLKCEIETYSNWRQRNYLTYEWGDWTPEWRYEWYKDSSKLQTSERYTVNRDTLSIVGAVTSDQGQYWCRGQRDGRPNSSHSSSVSLSVKYSPTSTLTVTPDSPVFTGETVNLKCEIETYSNWRQRNYQTYEWGDWTHEWRYEWYKDSSKLQTSERYTVNRDTLSIVGAVTSDQGQYWCRGLRDGRPNSSHSSSVSLSVKDSPTSTLTVTPDRSVFTGETVNLKCVIETYRYWIWRNYHRDDWRDWTHEWRYEWYKGSSKLQKSECHTVTRDTLSIVEAVTSDQGQYWCRGLRDGRPNSSQSSSVVSLSVKDSPTSTLTVTPDRSVFTGETVNLKCVIETYSDWTWRNYQRDDRRYWTHEWRYEWYKGSSMLQASERHTVNRDTLSIVGAVTSDQGQYWCRGLRDGRPNSSHSSSVSLSVKDKPKPILTVKPQRSVFTGDTVSLSCDVGQSTGWTFLWRKDSNRESIDHSTKTISSVRVSDGGTYQCRAERGNYYTELSDTIKITVRERPKPVVRVQPDVRVFRGETVTLTCDIQEAGVWRYNWYKDYYSRRQVQIYYTAGQDKSYIITSVDWSHAGVYSCRGTQTKAPQYSEISDRVMLTVSDKPKPNLTVKPQSSVFTGDTVTLSCDVGQSTGWTFLWRKDSNRESIDHSTKTISSVRVSDGGTYQCRAERGNYYTELSDTIKITVRERPKPVVRVQPDVRVFRGETVTLTCDIQEAGVWRYNWYKDYYSRRQVQIYYTAGQDKSYIITSVDWSHAGVYSCRGTQTKAPQYSEISDRVMLTVSDKPKPILTVKPQRSVFTGDTVTLSCDVGQSTGWTFLWRKDSNRESIDHSTKTISSVRVSDGGTYQCRAERGNYYTELSDTIKITVRERPKPVVRVQPDVRVFRGETVTLTCDIQEAGVWRYNWYKDYYSRRQVQIYYTAGQDKSYIITSVDWSHAGVYSCRGTQTKAPQYSEISDRVMLTVSGLKPKPELTSDPAGAALTGNTVTLTCRMDPSTGYWDFYWYKHTLNPETEKRETNSYRLKIDSVSDGGQYWCRAGRGKPVYYTNYSDALWVNVTVSPKAVLTVRPDERVFRGETVTLRCEITWGGDTEWTYRWEIEGTNNLNINSANRCTKQECCTSGVNKQKHREAVSLCSTQELNISSVDHFHSGKYTCTGLMNTQSCQRSDAVTLTVSDEAQAAVRVSPQPWLTEGESVTLICEVSGSSTGWTFSWFRDHDHLSDSSRGAGGSYTLSPAALQHTGVYTCRAERGRPAYYTRHSSTQPLWVTGLSASVSLVINPSRSQHFSSDSLSLSCEDQSNSAGWTVRRYTDKDTKTCSTQTGSACVIESLSTSDTGVYWCQSESGEKRHPRNITVHDGEVILVSSVDPVIEGKTLTLHCLHRSTNSPILSADFYKDRSLVQNQTTGEMSITTVSKSHEGFYYCKTERGQSLHSWISVRASQSSSQSSSLLVIGVSVGLSFFLLFLVSLVLLWRHKNNKDHHRNTQQTSDSNRSGESHVENSPLQPGSDHIYDDVAAVNNGDKDDTTAESNIVMYSEVGTKVKKFKSKDINTAGPSDLTYAQINIQDKKKSKGKGAGLADVLIKMKSKEKYKGKSSESGDTLYSELNHNTDRGVDTEVGDATYAQVFKKKGHKKNKTRP
ncbi:titin-like isoform X2 [Ctenopharyngodon idella]|uniref:titin-like isoform X2 n=1 Tax=Ctenopharyngodon idella TaxID=7959 RepID=UPI00223154FF|nr:titin-like isoform X2 [Ctenopharyngodon idella]